MFFKNKFLLVIVNIFIISSLVLSVQAESPMDKARQVKKEISGMKGSLSKAFEDYQTNEGKLAKIEKKLRNNTANLQTISIKLSKSQIILAKRINNMYRHGNTSYFDILFNARSFNEFIVNVDFVNRISKKDSSIITRVRILRNQLSASQKQLIVNRKNQKITVSILRKKKNFINTKLSKAKSRLKGLEKEIAELAKPKPLPAPIQSQITPPNSPPSSQPKYSGSYAFPAGAPFSFSNDWGNPRSGGRRHKGTDILAPMGTPAFAVIGGSVGSSTGRSSGLWITLNGDDGNTYWYMHMQSITASGRVSTGQQIGTIGNTGNASGGPAHIHFELHPGGGGPVNPYFFLSSIQ